MSNLQSPNINNSIVQEIVSSENNNINKRNLLEDISESSTSEFVQVSQRVRRSTDKTNISNRNRRNANPPDYYSPAQYS